MHKYLAAFVLGVMVLWAPRSAVTQQCCTGEQCPGDLNCDNAVGIGELITAVNSALIGCSTPSVPPPNPLYVRTSGSDTNSGADPANALRTIRKAASLARSSYKIIVGPGSYEETEVTTVGTGTAPQGLQFIADVTGKMTGDPAGAVTVTPNATGKGNAGFNLFSSAGSLIDGFTITGFGDAGVVIKSGSDDFTIQNCIILNNPGDGIRVQDSRSVLVFNNLVHDNGGVGIGIVGQISGSPSAQLLSNTIANNGARGITVGNSNAASPGGLVHNNIVQDNNGDANIKVFTSPPSDFQYDGDYNLVFPGTYIPRTGIMGSNDLNVDAQFTDDFHVQPTSPAINAGGPLNLPNSQTVPLRARTVTVNGTGDSGTFDLGFHFLRTR